MGLLDNEGLAHFWGKVRAALAGKQDTITAVDGLSKEGDTLSVTTPVRGVVTQAEFDALPEERRNKGLYVIPDGGSGGGASPSGLGGIFRHMVIFQESGVFNPAEYGLKKGDIVSVTAVGGGGGGGVPRFSDGDKVPDGGLYLYGGDGGKSSANGGYMSGKPGKGYGAGGGGAQYPSRIGSTAAPSLSGGGGGGSGFVRHAVLRLPSADSIPVTVGEPGKGAKFLTNMDPYFTPGSDGGTSSFGEYLTVPGGEQGRSDPGNGNGGDGYAKGGDGGFPRNYTSKVYAFGGDGGSNGSPGASGERLCLGNNLYFVGGGGGGYVIPFSALEVETIGELVPGAGVVVVAW